MQAWEIIKTVYRPHLEKFPLIEALEFARLENLDLQIVKEYFIAASRGLKIGQ